VNTSKTNSAKKSHNLIEVHIGIEPISPEGTGLLRIRRANHYTNEPFPAKLELVNVGAENPYLAKYDVKLKSGAFGYHRGDGKGFHWLYY
jgi:hypothetical protein